MIIVLSVHILLRDCSGVCQLFGMAAQTQGIVKKLDNETISYVKATTVIGSLSRIVEECRYYLLYCLN